MYKIVAVALLHGADKHFLPGVATQQAADTGRGDIQSLGCLPVQLNFNGTLAPAIDLHCRDSVDIFQFVDHLLIDNIPYPVHTTKSAHLQRHEVAAHH